MFPNHEVVLEDKMLSDIEAKIKRSAPTVIIADQHHVARAALAYLLTYDGYRVFQADSFKAAVSHINYNEDLPLLIADLEMPDWRSIVRHAVKTTQALVIGMEGYIIQSPKCMICASVVFGCVCRSR